MNDTPYTTLTITKLDELMSVNNKINSKESIDYKDNIKYIITQRIADLFRGIYLNIGFPYSKDNILISTQGLQTYKSFTINENQAIIKYIQEFNLTKEGEKLADLDTLIFEFDILGNTYTVNTKSQLERLERLERAENQQNMYVLTRI